MKKDNKKEKIIQKTRLFIRIEDKDKEHWINAWGDEIIPTKWVEVPEIELGSIKNPNRKIFEIRMEPIQEAL